MLKKTFFIIFVFTFYNLNAQLQPYKNPALPIEQRVNDLIHRLTLEEKISLLGFRSKSVQRLGIPAYNWWNEALHGVARAGNATVFPQAIAMAASFNPELIRQVGDAVSTEARAKYNLAANRGTAQQYMGLTFWSPNINIFRDPRWGRGQETYGEDPLLTATMGTAFIKGIQGANSDYLKASACAKHFAVHSGPEKSRHIFNAVVDEKDLRETYLPAFKNLVNAGVESVMCGYNRLNGQPCCTNPNLLQHILRNEWGFKGHIVTDCWALEDIWMRHKSLPNSVAVAAEAIKNGVSLDCSNLLQDDALKAVQQNLLTENDINTALAGILKTQMKLGFFNEKNTSPYKNYGADSIANNYHTQLAKEMALQSMVLLKNTNNILPLNKSKYNAYMVVGPNAASLDALLGNYHGVSGKAVNFVEGITNALDKGSRIEYDMGCDFEDTTHFGGIWAASNADITIAVIGYSPVYEGEEGDAFLAKNGGDKTDIELPASQVAYMRALKKGIKTPVIAVVTGGGAVNTAAINDYADAIIYAWYPGEQGGAALADLLFGIKTPQGKLPVTFYKNVNDLPAYDDYAMENRTYRYFKRAVNYPFGFGLSYTSFSYNWLQQPGKKYKENDVLNFDLQIKNTGAYNGAETIQAYVQYPDIGRMPVKELKAFKKIHIEKGGHQQAHFSININELKKWDMQSGNWKLYPGDYKLIVGSHSMDSQLSYTFKIL